MTLTARFRSFCWVFLLDYRPKPSSSQNEVVSQLDTPVFVVINDLIRFNAPIAEAIFYVIFWICNFHESCLSMCAPKDLTALTLLISQPSSSIVILPYAAPKLSQSGNWAHVVQLRRSIHSMLIKMYAIKLTFMISGLGPQWLID